jgi:hypothetical protein
VIVGNTATIRSTIACGRRRRIVAMPPRFTASLKYGQTASLFRCTPPNSGQKPQLQLANFGHCFASESDGA